MDSSSRWSGMAVSFIVTVIIMALIRKVNVFQPVINSSKTLAELEEEYRNWDQLSFILVAVFVGLVGFLTWGCLSTLATIQISHIESGKYLIPQHQDIWILLAFFMGLILSSIPLHFLYLTLLGKERYGEYTEYADRKHGVNGLKVFTCLASGIVPVCLALTFLALDSYTRVTDDAFVVNRFFGIGEKSYGYDEIKNIKLTKSFEAPNGNIVRRDEYTIHFTDGTDFEFLNALHDIKFEQEKEIIEFVSARSNKKIIIIDPFPI